MGNNKIGIKKILIYLILSIGAVIVLFPFYWMILTSVKDYGQYKAPANLIRFLRTPLEAARCVFDIDGTALEKTVLHPVGLLAATAQGTLAIEKDSADYELALDWVRWFFNTPLRTGGRRYYDNCLYLFALLALSGNYRIY